MISVVILIWIWRPQNNHKGLTPAIGASPYFCISKKFFRTVMKIYIIAEKTKPDSLIYRVYRD